MQFAPLDWQVNDQYPNNESYLNNIPLAINSFDSRPVIEQLRETAAIVECPEGLGWELTADNFLCYPGLPPLAPAAKAAHIGEQVFIYPHGFGIILQLSGAFELVRFGVTHTD
jgi:hypothetical protein